MRTPSPKRAKPSLDVEELVRDARAELQAKLDEGKADFGLGTYESFGVDQTRALMELSSGGKVRVRAKAQIVGSFSTSSGTWMWSWANDSILPVMRERIAEVRAFGEAHRIPALTTGQWPATEGDGWSMTAVAASILGSQCAYRIPTRSGATFLLLDELTAVG